MNKPQPENTITVSCPSGHRLRGGFEMFGKNVKCPRCQAAFVFAPDKANDSDHRAVTDTGVMRILGDMPQVTPPPQPSQTDNRAVTDTGVMRILGDMPQLASPPQLSQTENRGVTRHRRDADSGRRVRTGSATETVDRSSTTPLLAMWHRDPRVVSGLPSLQLLHRHYADVHAKDDGQPEDQSQLRWFPLRPKSDDFGFELSWTKVVLSI